MSQHDHIGPRQADGDRLLRLDMGRVTGMLAAARLHGFTVEPDRQGSGYYTLRCQGSVYCLCETSLDVLDMLARVACGVTGCH